MALADISYGEFAKVIPALNSTQQLFVVYEKVDVAGRSGPATSGAVRIGSSYRSMGHQIMHAATPMRSPATTVVPSIAINVSGNTLSHDSFLEFAEHEFELSSVPPERGRG